MRWDEIKLNSTEENKIIWKWAVEYYEKMMIKMCCNDA